MFNKKNKTDFFYLIIILISCCIAFWPLTFNIYSLKNDALNYFLPVRFNISEAIQNGFWPFWSPYLNLGYPLHGDMQSGVWNPFVQIFSLFGVYTIKMLQYETLLYVYISGISMFYLLKHFIPEKAICLFGAISYMLCGYISDSAQFLNWISSASFIPFVFLFYYRVLNEKSVKQSLYCALFLFLLFTTAYPADFIIMCYLLLALLITQIFRKKLSKQEVYFLFKQHLVLIVFFIALSLPAIISYEEFLSLTERGSGADFQTAMSNPLHPKLLFAYLTPIGIWKAPGVNVTDPLERNSFIGLFGFTFLMISILSKNKHPLFLFSKWAFFIFLLFSFGTYGGIRVLSYYFLPLMDAFRHPANAKIFTTFFAVILASITLKEISLVYLDSRKIKVILFTLCSLFFFIFCWSLYLPTTLWSINFLDSSQSISLKIKTIIDQLTFSDLLIINIVLQFPFLIVLYLFFLRKTKLKIFVITGIINSIIHVMLFQPFTVVKKDTVKATQSILNNVKVDGYPLPDLYSSLSENSLNGYTYFKEIGVSNLYNKQIGRVDYRITPSNLLNQNDFWFNEKWRDYFLSLPIFYKSDSLLSSKVAHKHFSYDSLTRYILTDNQDLINESIHFPKKRDSLKYSFLNFTPNYWSLHVASNQVGYYCFFQNYYPRWSVYVNGKKIKTDICNISFIGFIIPPGNNMVTFKYESMDLKITYILSLLLIIFIIYTAIKVKSKQTKSFFLS